MKTLLFSLAAVAALSLAALLLAQTNGVPSALLSKMHNGVNITRWFCYLEGGKDPIEHFQTYMLEEDFAAFKMLGLDYVRLCVSPDAIYDKGQPNAKHLPYLDAALDRLAKHRLTFLLDLHDNGQLKLDAVDQDNSGFVSFWEAMARHYKGKHQKAMVFELVNEPVFTQNPKVWYELQEKTVKAVRAIDPDRTIMVSGTSWSGIDAFGSLPPLSEKNLIYTFHCYDPFYFTHQGASWVGPQPKDFKSVPFPASPEAVQAILPQNALENYDALKGYGNERFDAAYMLKRISQAAQYGKDHDVPVLLGEFGAYPPAAPIESRARWFEAIRTAIDASNVPFCIWGYDDGLGLGRSVKDGKVVLDPVTLKAFYRK